jgi:hypothetical protein
VLRSHLGSIATMEKHLSKAIIDLFDGWTPTFNSCNPIVLRAPGMPCNRYVFSLLLYFSINFILIDKVRLFSSDQTQVSLHCIASRTSMVTVSYDTPQRYEIILKFMDTQHILIKILFIITKFILFQVNLQKFKEYILYEMLDLSGNTGQLPSVFCHILE